MEFEPIWTTEAASDAARAGLGHESVEHAVASVEHRFDGACATLIGREVGGDLGIAKVDADDGIARRFEHRPGRGADP